MKRLPRWIRLWSWASIKVRAGLSASALAFCFMASILHPGTAAASTATGTLAVQMQITAACTVGASSLTFASTSATSLLSTQVVQTGTISVTCSNSSPYAVGLDNGQNALSGQRRLANGTNYISYNIFVDNNQSNPWTTGSSSTSCTTANSCSLGTGNGSAQTINVYGVVPVVTTAPASGTYSDSVTVTVTY